MEESLERQPLLRSVEDGRDRRQSVVSFHERDSENPLEWSNKYKWFYVTLLCIFGAVVYGCFMATFRCPLMVSRTFTCIGIVPVAADVVRELKGERDRSATVLFVTIWELGEAMGPLFLAPLSELYGRYRVYNVANCLFVLGVALTAISQNVGLLVFSRFATGCAVATNILNPVIIGDMFPSESRGSAMSAIMLAPLVGGAIGPTISGAIAEAAGWREVMWMCVGIAVVIELLFLILFQETYEPVILKRRAAKKRKETGDDAFVTEYDGKQESTFRTLIQSISRPARIAWSSTMLQSLSLWGGVMFSFYYVNLTFFADILEVVYGFSPSKRGLSYLACRSFTGLIVCNRLTDNIYNKLNQRRGKFYPEARLPISIVGAFLVPMSVLLYGWTAQAQVHVPWFLATITLLGLALVFFVVPLMTFITDAFGQYSASAMTAVLVTRCLLGAFLPLTVPPLADKFGYGWAFTVIAGLGFVLAPIPCLVMRYGPTWRQRSEFTRDK